LASVYTGKTNFEQLFDEFRPDVILTALFKNAHKKQLANAANRAKIGSCEHANVAQLAEQCSCKA
jgi:dTDP-4-dehydrorhamnose reductase